MEIIKNETENKLNKEINILQDQVNRQNKKHKIIEVYFISNLDKLIIFRKLGI
jgi:hypothetical protein